MVKLFKVWFGLLLAGLFFPQVLGCSMLYEGGGEISLGMRNDNFLVIKHTVDGDKEGKTAKVQFEGDGLLDLVVGVEPDAGSNSD